MSADKASKRPWSVHRISPFGEDCVCIQLKDADNRGVLEIRGRKELAEANAKLILDGVNRLGEAEKLVRRFVELVNHQAPVVSVFSLLDAEEPGWRELPEAERTAKVQDGYKRLSRLMTAAYDAIGEEEA